MEASHKGYIKIEESNFLPKGTQVRFENNNFYFCKSKLSEKQYSISGENIRSMNRANVRRVGSFDGNIFSNLFKGGVYVALFMEIMGFAKRSTGKQRLSIHFKDDKYFTGFTDLETFFKVQDVWIMHK